MARSIVSATTTISIDDETTTTAAEGGVLKSDKKKSYIPGPFHLTTLLNVFIPLFNRVRRQISAEEMRFPNVPSILQVFYRYCSGFYRYFSGNFRNSGGVE